MTTRKNFKNRNAMLHFVASTDYEDKLDKKMTEIMDKVVLSDLLIEEAVAEFKKM